MEIGNAYSESPCKMDFKHKKWQKFGIRVLLESTWHDRPLLGGKITVGPLGLYLYLTMRITPDLCVIYLFSLFVMLILVACLVLILENENSK